ncbi:HIRAN domain-containing protein [Clostridium sp. JN-1]|uniref:HIRAN domain-containing protein n=1 Tax=Clostridium sp. JN-1 TaxID=2483110 RepID=UPI000F0B29A1|nr:HIRAN domain-containing protein [Clostridium sp. JN-1]
MSIKCGRDYIYLVWKDIKTRRQYIVGQLSKNGQFEFNYGFEVEEAIKQGFKLLISFEEINKVYKSDILFPAFSSRLPDSKRKGIEKILSKYGLDDYDAYKLLKRSGAKLPIDNLEFIDPILDENEEIIKRIFYLAGPRHYIGCEGIDCAKAENLEVGDVLQLVLEPENKFDRNAIKVLNENSIHIGYIPRFYSESIINLLNKGYTYNCNIYEIQKDNNCNECVKIQLEMKK